MNTIKLILPVVLIVFYAIAASAAGVTTTVRPPTVAEGEMVYYSITMPQKPDKPIALPEVANARWITNAPQYSSSTINGVSSFTLTIPLQVQKTGEIKIPAFEIQTGGKTLTTEEQLVKVVPRGEQPAPVTNTGTTSEQVSISMKEAVQARIKLLTDRRSFFVGEEIPVELQLDLLPELNARLAAYPELTGLHDVVFKDYAASNPEARNFDQLRQRPVMIGDRRYLQVVFPTAFRATRPGKLVAGGEVTLAIPEVEPAQSRRVPSMFDDDFMDSFFNRSRTRYQEYRVSFAPMPEIIIHPLPVAPQGAINTTLIGDWRLQATLEPTSVKAGEPVTLRITAVGSGSTEGITAPKLTLAGFRVYPPELTKLDQGAQQKLQLQYALIPLKAGEHTVSLKLAVFDPLKKAYAVHDVSLKLPVTQADRMIAAVSDQPQIETAEPLLEPEDGSAEPQPQPRNELFYQKSSIGNEVELPLIRNQWGWLLLFLIGGPVTALLLELKQRRKLRRQNDPDYQRKEALRSQCGKLIRALKQAHTAEAQQQLLHQELVPYLAAQWGLPPSATAGEISEKIDDPELKAFFSSGEASGFLPAGAKIDQKTLSAEGLAKLLKLLKHQAIWLFLLLALPLTGGTSEQFNALFDQGKYQEALSQYQQELKPYAPAPALLYNLGNTAYRLADLPLARYYLTQANLLAPRDNEIQENLNFVNRKLIQPEVGLTTTPRLLLLWCRDLLRPDQYLVIAAAAIALSSLSFAFRRQLKSKVFWSAELFALLLFALSLAAAATQMQGRYAPDRAIVVAPQIELRTLPATGSGSVEATIPGGCDATVIERRGDWVRVQINGRDGWAPVNQLKMTFPDGLF